MTIYTKKGDKGKTKLPGGLAIPKSSLVLNVVGTIDELNSALGLLHLSSDKTINFVVLQIQKDLFKIGAELASEKFESNISEKTTWLESEIDKLSSALPELNHFILPGGSKNSAYFHVCRSICRRVERLIVELENEGNLKNKDLIKYINRLSDLLFVMARYANFKVGIKDILWKNDEN